ncbi:MAG TPA: hypothetical protein VIJ41_05760 [Candidatus Nanopelagicales bacterium]
MSGRKTPGDSSPRPGWFQRARASAATICRVTGSTSGWNHASNSWSSNAVRRAFSRSSRPVRVERIESSKSTTRLRPAPLAS